MAASKFDQLAPVPICSPAAIHFSVMAVSVRSFLSSSTSARSPFSRVAKPGSDLWSGLNRAVQVPLGSISSLQSAVRNQAERGAFDSVARNDCLS